MHTSLLHIPVPNPSRTPAMMLVTQIPDSPRTPAGCGCQPAIGADTSKQTLSSQLCAQHTRSEKKFYLASRSPRREHLLTEAGYAFETIIPDVDDSHLCRGSVEPQMWVQALAYFKAMAGAHKIRPGVSKLDIPAQQPANTLDSVRLREPIVLGADTVCVMDNRIIGKPQSKDEATEMIARFVGASHDVFTGVALVDLHTHTRVMFTGTSRVQFGYVSQSTIDSYIDSGNWEDKAGGYNLTERLADGWDIGVTGDPENVVGLPMKQLSILLKAVGVHPQTAQCVCADRAAS